MYICIINKWRWGYQRVLGSAVDKASKSSPYELHPQFLFEGDVTLENACYIIETID